MHAAALEDKLLDTRYRVETPEGIGLALTPAGIVSRSYAFMTDFGFRVSIFGIVVTVLASLGRFGFGLGLIVFFALEWLYPVVFELSPWAATPGKRMLGLRVVMDSGLPVTPAASLTRNLLRAADFMPFLYLMAAVSMLVRHDFKRLGDLAAATLVVHVAQPPRAETIPEGPPRAPAAPLSGRAQAAVIAWAARLPRLTEARADELAAIAAPTVTPTATDGRRVEAMVGVARWLIGRR